MRHIIAHSIRGEAKIAHEAITKDLAEKFDSFPIHERIPPHLTLKRWFELDEQGMDALYKTLDAFAASQKQSDYGASGSNAFAFLMSCPKGNRYRIYQILDTGFRESPNE